MSNISTKRIMIAAPGSGSGKTTITCAILEALKKRGLGPVSFKCGPDYIDPLFHKKVLGIDSRNLDSFFSDTETLRSTLAACGDRFAVIEGVMGLYDGISVSGTEGSSYEMAAILETPIILVVDGAGTGRTLISLIKGVLLDDIHHLIKGIILNRTSRHFYETLKPVLEKELSSVRNDVSIIGCLPKNPEINIGSRHLGLMLPDEIDNIKRKLSDAAVLLEENADMNMLISIMEEAGGGGTEDNGSCSDPLFHRGEDSVETTAQDGCGLTLAVALDAAFCFYYSENLDIFRKHGVRISFFSPLYDEALPRECDAALFGGGYPENHLPVLSSNRSMLKSIKEALDKGLPCLAECGGFMYLHRAIANRDGTSYDMVGAVDGECYYSGHLVRFGYLEIESENDEYRSDELKGSFSGMRGHEFHYYDSSCNGDAYTAFKPGTGKKWNCIVAENNAIMGFPHFYYNSNPEFVRAFIKRMREVKNG